MLNVCILLWALQSNHLHDKCQLLSGFLNLIISTSSWFPLAFISNPLFNNILPRVDNYPCIAWMLVKEKCALVISGCIWRHSMKFTNNIVFVLYRLIFFLIPSNIRYPSKSVSMLCNVVSQRKKGVKMHKYLSIGVSFIYYFCIFLHEDCYYSDLPTVSGRMCIINSFEQRQYIQIFV